MNNWIGRCVTTRKGCCFWKKDWRAEWARSGKRWHRNCVGGCRLSCDNDAFVHSNKKWRKYFMIYCRWDRSAWNAIKNATIASTPRKLPLSCCRNWLYKKRRRIWSIPSISADSQGHVFYADTPSCTGASSTSPLYASSSFLLCWRARVPMNGSQKMCWNLTAPSWWSCAVLRKITNEAKGTGSLRYRFNCSSMSPRCCKSCF